MMTPRAECYERRFIRGCGRIFSFINELQLFAEVDHHTKYSINLYGPPQDQLAFDHLANLFTPTTVDACYAHDGTGTVVDIRAKMANGTSQAIVTASCG